MQVYCKGTARIRHHATSEIQENESDELTGMLLAAASARWDRRSTMRQPSSIPN